MLKKYILIFAISLMISQVSEAQKFGKFDESLLSQSHHPIDSSAEAAYISQKVEIAYETRGSRGLQMKIDYYYLIKVYKESGEEYANFEISYGNYNNQKEQVRSIDAVTYNLVNGKMVEKELEKHDMWDEEVHDRLSYKKFALPDVKSGSVMEVKYTLYSPFLYSIPKWYFQHPIPTDYSEYYLELPEYLTLTPIPSGAFPLQTEGGERNIGRDRYVTHKLSATDVPAYDEDQYVLNENDYRSGIKYEIHTVRVPGRPVEYLSKDWNEIAKNLYEDGDFGGQITRKLKDLDPIVDEAKKLEESERAVFLYDYVQKNYAWNKYYGVYSSDGLKKVVETKTGSIADLNLLLINLCQKSGLNASPLLTKNRNGGILNTSYPSLTELNYVLAKIDVGDQGILADVSNKRVPLGQLPRRAINLYGISIREDGAQIMSLHNPNFFKTSTLSVYTLDLENNKLVGTSQRKRSDYAATSYRIEADDEENSKEGANNQEEDDEQVIESFDLKNTYKVTEIDGFDDNYADIKIKYDEEIVTATSIIGDKIFIDATVDFGLKKNPFLEKERNFPVFYNNEVEVNYITGIEIPEGYDIESAPETKMIMMPDNKATFSYEIKRAGNKFYIYYIFKINDDIILPEDYPYLYELYNLMYAKTKEKIVLRQNLIKSSALIEDLDSIVG